MFLVFHVFYFHHILNYVFFSSLGKRILVPIFSDYKEVTFFKAFLSFIRMGGALAAKVKTGEKKHEYHWQKSILEYLKAFALFFALIVSFFKRFLVDIRISFFLMKKQLAVPKGLLESIYLNRNLK